MFCACGLTCRPLFTKLGLSKLFSKGNILRCSTSKASTQSENERDPHVHRFTEQDSQRRHEHHNRDLNAQDFSTELMRDEYGFLKIGVCQANWSQRHIRTEPSRSVEILDARPSVPPKPSESTEIMDTRPTVIPKQSHDRKWELRHF